MPFLLKILHLLQIFLTEALTFMMPSLLVSATAAP
jgi:hypothetical protein